MRLLIASLAALAAVAFAAPSYAQTQDDSSPAPAPVPTAKPKPGTAAYCQSLKTLELAQLVPQEGERQRQGHDDQGVRHHDGEEDQEDHDDAGRAQAARRRPAQHPGRAGAGAVAAPSPFRRCRRRPSKLASLRAG